MAVQNQKDVDRFLVDGITSSEIPIKLPNEIQLIKKIHMWGLVDSSKNLLIWESITKNDWFIFSLNKKYQFAGKVNMKLKIQSPFRFIKNTTKFENNRLIIFFSEIFKIDSSYSRINRELGFASELKKMHKIDFLKCQPDRINLLINKYKSIENFLHLKKIINEIIIDAMDASNISLESMKDFKLPKDVEEPPIKIHAEILRTIRDTEKTKKLKKIYNHQCQICGTSLKISNSQKYSEVHHIWPLGEGGLDDYHNMIVLCPNHHTQFDFASIGFDNKDNCIIIDMNKNKIGEIIFHKSHQIRFENINHHIRRMNAIWD